MRTPLGYAALLVLAVNVLHDLDHVRQGTTTPAAVVATAIAGWTATIVLLVLVARRHELATRYAAGFGLALATGFVLVHLLPHWSTFSQSYADQDADALSWVLAVLPVLAGLCLSAVALRFSSKNRRMRPQASSAEAS
jgi:hypothetical protein